MRTVCTAHALVCTIVATALYPQPLIVCKWCQLWRSLCPHPQGVYGDVVVGEFPLELVPVEDDVISLELSDGAFRDCVADGDSTSLFYFARAVMRLQGLFGLVPRIQVGGQGRGAM